METTCFQTLVVDVEERADDDAGDQHDDRALDHLDWPGHSTFLSSAQASTMKFAAPLLRLPGGCGANGRVAF